MIILDHLSLLPRAIWNMHLIIKRPKQTWPAFVSVCTSDCSTSSHWSVSAVWKTTNTAFYISSELFGFGTLDSLIGWEYSGIAVFRNFVKDSFFNFCIFSVRVLMRFCYIGWDFNWMIRKNQSEFIIKVRIILIKGQN